MKSALIAAAIILSGNIALAEGGHGPEVAESGRRGILNRLLGPAPIKKETPPFALVEYSRGEDTAKDRERCGGDYETARIKASLVQEQVGRSQRVLLKYNAMLVNGIGAAEGTEFALLDTTDRTQPGALNRLKFLSPDRKIRATEQCKTDKIDAGLSLRGALDLGDLGGPGEKEGYASIVLPTKNDDGSIHLLQKQIIHWKLNVGKDGSIGDVSITVEEPAIQFENENGEMETRDAAFLAINSGGLNPAPKISKPLRAKPENCDKGGEAPGKAAFEEGGRKDKKDSDEGKGKSKRKAEVIEDSTEDSRSVLRRIFRR